MGPTWGLRHERLRRLAATGSLANIEAVADARRPLLVYAALGLITDALVRFAERRLLVWQGTGAAR